ncbi:MAG: U32 family peptidase [Clostridia bacterium]|nr:U32 family peptidase [Clostridia bacterium]
MAYTGKMELLCPAGSMDALEAALHFGADAVYAGMKRFGLRAFAGNFDEPSLRMAVEKTHRAGKKFYLTMNVFPYDDQLEAFVGAARLAHAIGVDAAIVSDLGAIVTLRREVPGLPIHVSTQASTVNSAAVEHYRQLGCQRVILAREVSIERAGKINANLEEQMELEMFAHGASCMAWSGRCMLSAEMTGRSANQGACAQPCRWQYAVMEMKRPGEYMPVCEDENGTYIFSAKDLNLMPVLPEMKRAGIASLKVEGRMKTEYYVATVAAAYRRGIDILEQQGEEAFRAALPSLMEELSCASHRDSDTGFAVTAPEQPAGAEGFHQTREYIAKVAEDCPDGKGVRFLLKNRFFAGDELELLTPSGVKMLTAPRFIREKTGEECDTLGIGGEIICMDLPFGVEKGDILRGPVRNHRG